MKRSQSPCVPAGLAALLVGSLFPSCFFSDERASVELTRKNGDSKGGDSFRCNEAACSKATGLTYCNVEWVNACTTLPKTRLTLSGFSPFQALTRSLHVPHPAKGASPPGRSVVDGCRRDERTRDIPQSAPRSLISAGKPTTGIQVVHAFRPCCLNSLTPDAHRAGPLHPIAASAEVSCRASFPASTFG